VLSELNATAPWPTVSLGEVLRKSDAWITPEPMTQYREVTVRLWGRGVVERRNATGAEIAGRRLVVRAGQFVLSRIDARNGAFGIIPSDLDGALVSNDFPVFDVDITRTLPTYLEWLSKTRDFVDLCRAASEGTTNRVRLKEDRFLAALIPLPPLDEQRRIVARIEALAAKVEEARRLRRRAIEETEALMRGCLDRCYASAARDFGAHDLSRLSKIITDGDHLTPSFTEAGVRFIFVGNVSSGRLNFNGCKYVDPSYYSSLSPNRKPARGDLLYSAVGATLGVPALVDVDDKFCFQRHIAIIKPDSSKLQPRYLFHMLRSGSIINRAWASTTGSAQPTVPLRAIRAFPIPMPPMREQHRIIAYLDDLQLKVDLAKQQQADTEAEVNALLPSILDKAFKGGL
jgi:type I restriction enzyme S subunit